MIKPPTTYSRCVDKLLNDVCSLDDSELPQYVTPNPYSEAIEQLNALFNTGSLFSRLGCTGVRTELLQLERGGEGGRERENSCS